VIRTARIAELIAPAGGGQPRDLDVKGLWVNARLLGSALC